MRLSTFTFPATCLFLLAMALLLPPAHGGLHVVGSHRKLLIRETTKPTVTVTTRTQEPVAPISVAPAGIGSGLQYDPPYVAYNMWTVWGSPASGAIPSCAYWALFCTPSDGCYYLHRSTQQLKGFVGCAAKQTYPDGLPPAVNWTVPQTCLDKYAGMKECQFGEVGYAIMQTSNSRTSVKLIYGTAVGGCKDALNYYAIAGQSRPRALTAKACTSVNTKILACILATNNDMNQFENTYTGCSVYVSQRQSALATACWTNPGTYTVWYDGYNNTAWLAAFPTTTGLAQYTIFPTSQAFYKGGHTGDKKTIVAGNMGSLQPWL